MGQVFAGFVAGYVVALVLTPLLAVMLMRWRVAGGLLARLVPDGVSTLSLGVLLHGVLFLFWTCLGIVLGLLLLAMEGAGGAAGSPNVAFTLFVIGLLVMVVAPLVALLPRLRLALLLSLVLVIAIFGWLMPHMATWSKFESDETPSPRTDVHHAIAL